MAIGWHDRGWLVSLLGSLVFGLAGCGGGGGSGSSTPAPEQGTAEVFSSDHVPLAVGDRMLWRPTSGTTRVATQSVVGTTAIGGATAFDVRDEEGLSEYLVKAVDRVTAVPGPNADTLTQALGAVDLLRFGLRAGDSAELLDRTITADLDGDGRPDRATLRLRMTVVGFEAYAGSLPGIQRLAQVRTELMASFSLSAYGNSTLTQTSDEWYAQNVGRVRSRVRTVEDGGPESVEEHELMAYGVGGLRSDTTPPRVSQSEPAQGGMTQNLSVMRVQLSESIDPSSLAGADGLRIVDGQSGQVTSSWSLSPDGLTLSIQLTTTEWPEGRYEVRFGPGVVDWANNPLQQTITFGVDRTVPLVVSSLPSGNADGVSLTPTLSFTLDDEVRAVGSVVIEVTEVNGYLYGRGGPVQWPATVSGRTVTAQVTTPLQRNAEYVMQIVGTLADRAGNVTDRASDRFTMGWPSTRFRTDPGPLARPTALVPGHRVFATDLVDANRDGRPDLVFAALNEGTGDAWLGVRTALAAGGLAAVQRLATLPNSCRPPAMAIGDFDGNGFWDVALNCSIATSALMQTPTGDWAFSRMGAYGGRPIDVVDLDGDGRAEVVLAGEPLLGQLDFRPRWQVARYVSPGVWTTVADIAAGADYNFLESAAAQVVDLDQDGRTDLVWLRTYYDGRQEVAWALRSGSGFGAVQSAMLPNGPRGVGLLVTDLDGDSKPELLLGRDSDLLLWPIQPGASVSFGTPRVLVSTQGLGQPALVDADGSGRLDLAYVNKTMSTLNIALQRGDGTLESGRSFELSAQGLDSSPGILLVDVDGDGRQDLVVGGDVLLRRDWTQAWPAGTKRALTVRPTGPSGALRVLRSGGLN